MDPAGVAFGVAVAAVLEWRVEQAMVDTQRHSLLLLLLLAACEISSQLTGDLRAPLRSLRLQMLGLTVVLGWPSSG